MLSILSRPRDLLTLAQAARAFPEKPHPSTLWRWRRKGIGGVRLRTVRIGGKIYVPREAIDEFVSALTASYDRSAPVDGNDVRSLGPAAETHDRLAAAGLV